MTSLLGERELSWNSMDLEGDDVSSTMISHPVLGFPL